MFSPCERYRYLLGRCWDTSRPSCAWLMLNPSTADAMRDDPTVRRCRRLADSWGYGSLEVINIFSYRSTDPAQLRRQSDPVGPHNDRWIRRVARRADLLVCAWGEHGALNNRDARIAELLASIPDARAVGVNASGRPKHPLYVARTVEPKPFRLAALGRPERLSR